MNILQVSDKTLNRFWSKVQVGQADECWNWTGSAGSGSPRFNSGVEGLYHATRFLYSITFGSIPENKRVLHTCGNPICCNPNHLKLGEETEERFWSKVNRSSAGGCWEWKGRLSLSGYGQFAGYKDGNKATLAAHRVSYELSYGLIPEGFHVCHKCDNRKCVNPQHLFLGTPKDNQEDMTSKERGRIGTRNGRAVLSDEDIPKIRQLLKEGHSQMSIASQFGVNQHTISCIKRRVRWAHVPDDATN